MLNKKLFLLLFLFGILTAVAGTTEVSNKKVFPARVRSRRITGIFQTTGKGADSNWGVKGEVDFKLMVYTVIESKIVSKKVQRNGFVQVVEEREFKRYIEELVTEPSGLKFDFSTLPIEEFLAIVNASGAVLSAIKGNPAYSVNAFRGNGVVKLIVNKFDGKNIPGIKPDMLKIVKKLADLKMGLLIKKRPVEGQRYRITYLQNRKGTPMRVKFENVSGAKLTDEEETILKRSNAFINSDIVPDVNRRIGGSWYVNARDMEEFFDPFLPGNVSGEIKFTRKANDANKNWNIEMTPPKGGLLIYDDNGLKIGTIELTQGHGTVEPKKFCNVLNMETAGRVKIEKTNKHHMLFTAKLSSWCQYHARVISEDLE